MDILAFNGVAENIEISKLSGEKEWYKRLANDDWWNDSLILINDFFLAGLSWYKNNILTEYQIPSLKLTVRPWN